MLFQPADKLRHFLVRGFLRFFLVRIFVRCFLVRFFFRVFIHRFVRVFLGRRRIFRFVNHRHIGRRFVLRQRAKPKTSSSVSSCRFSTTSPPTFPSTVSIVSPRSSVTMPTCRSRRRRLYQKIPDRPSSAYNRPRSCKAPASSSRSVQYTQPAAYGTSACATPA